MCCAGDAMEGRKMVVWKVGGAGGGAGCGARSAGCGGRQSRGSMESPQFANTTLENRGFLCHFIAVRPKGYR